MEQSSQIETSSQDLGSTPASTPAEKLVTISESKFNDTIRHSNARVAEKARQEERASWEAKMNTNNSTPQAQSSISPDEVRRIASEAADARHQELVNQHWKNQADAEGNRLAQEFFNKLNNADKKLYPNLEKNIKDADFSRMPEVVSLANSMEGTEGIINELLENPSKIPVMRDLAVTQPELAKKELKRMADSIRLNQQGAQAKMPREPLSRIEPSPVGMDNGSDSSMSVSDYMKLFKSRQR